MTAGTPLAIVSSSEAGEESTSASETAKSADALIVGKLSRRNVAHRHERLDAEFLRERVELVARPATAGGGEEPQLRLLGVRLRERLEHDVEVRVRAEVAQREAHDRVVGPAELGPARAVALLRRVVVDARVPEDAVELLARRAEPDDASSSACELTTYASALSGAMPMRARSSASGELHASTIASFPHGPHKQAESGARRPVAVRQEVVRVDDVGLRLARDLLQRGDHPVAAEERDAVERVDVLELMDDKPVVLARARVEAAGRDVHLVALLGEPLRPTHEVARLRVADPEDA